VDFLDGVAGSEGGVKERFYNATEVSVRRVRRPIAVNASDSLSKLELSTRLQPPLPKLISLIWVMRQSKCIVGYSP